MDNVETVTQAIDYILREKTKTIKFLRQSRADLEKENKDLRARVAELELEKYNAAKNQQKNKEAVNA